MLRTAIIACGLCWPAGVAGQSIPAGDQYQVNTYTTYSQRLPAVAATSSDGFIVVWQNPLIRAQLLNSSGNLIGGEFQVNSHTGVSQGRVSVASVPSGGFIVAWHCFCSTQVGSDSDGRSIQLRRFDSNGSAIGNQIQVNTYTTGDQRQPSVAVGPSAEFVVVWQSAGSPESDSDGYSIQGMRFDSSGVPMGTQFQVNSYTSGNQMLAPVNTKAGFSVAVGPTGDFVVVWHSDGSDDTDNDGYSVQGQMFSSGGTVIGGQFQINSLTTNDQRLASVAVGSTGDFVVVWDRSSFDIAGQRFSSNGSKLGGEFQANSPLAMYGSRYATVAFSPSDEFVVAWVDDMTYGDIRGRQFAPDGTPSGDDSLISTYTTSYQFGPTLATDTAGNFIVVWDSDGSVGSDSDGYSIQARRFRFTIFSDGFESGNTSAWSNVVP